MKRLLFLLALLLLASRLEAQTLYPPLCPGGSCQFFDNAGVAAASAKLCTYAAGTSTPLGTYADSAGMSSNANPTILSTAGRATIFLRNATYKFLLLTPGTDTTCSTGTTIFTVDNVAAWSIWNWTSAFPNCAGANQAVQYSTGTGLFTCLSNVQVGVTTGAWTPTDASGGGVTYDVAVSLVDTVSNGLSTWIEGTATITWHTTADTHNAAFNLPVAAINTGNALLQWNHVVDFTDYSAPIYLNIQNAGSTAALFSSATGAQITNAGMSGKTLRFVFRYRTS